MDHGLLGHTDDDLEHLVFAIGLTGYILIAIRYEERDLVTFHGADYARYRDKVPTLVPHFGQPHQAVKTPKHPLPG